MKKFKERNAGTKIALALLAIIVLLMLFSPAVSAQMLGDVNNDGYIDIRDVVLVQRHVLGYQPPLTAAMLTAADVNGDGVVNVVDVNLMMQYIQGYISSFPNHHLQAPVLTSPSNNTAISGSSVLFRWNAVTGATKYQLEVLRGTESLPFKDVTLGNITMSEQFGFLRDGTQYRWRVRAGNNSGWGAWSGYFTLTSGSVPVAPVLVSPINVLTPVAGRQVSFSWQAVTGAINYELEIINERTGAFLTKASQGNVTSSLQRGFDDDGTPFKWRVRAAGSEGWGAWSNYAHFINGNLPAGPVLTEPPNNYELNGDRVAFEWNPVPGASRYELLIEYDTAGGAEFRRVMLGYVHAYRITDFPNDGSEFRWSVRAGNANGWGEFTTPFRKFTNGSPFARTTLINPQAFASINSEPIKFSWNAVSGATDYEVEIVNVRFGTSVSFKAGNVTSTEQSGFNFVDGAQYRWRVRAGNGTSWGAWSAARDFITEDEPNQAVPALSLLSPADTATAGGDTIGFRCTLLPGIATYYQFQIVRVAGGQMFKDVTHPTTPLYDADSQSFIISGFPDDGTVFMWRARAGNAGGDGGWSFYRTFTNGSYWWNISF